MSPNLSPSPNQSAVLNLYAINDYSEKFLLIVAATGSEHAIEEIKKVGIAGWDFGRTVFRRIQRNIGGEPGVLTAIEMHGTREGFRVTGGTPPKCAISREQGHE